MESAGGSDTPCPKRLRGAAALLMRDVVRAWLLREAPPPNTISLYAPLRGGDSDEDAPLTLDHLLPAADNPADEAAEQDLNRQAEAAAICLFTGLSHRERVILAARAVGRSLADGVVEGIVLCRKSILYDTLRRIVKAVAEHIGQAYARDGTDVQHALARRTLQALSERAAAWAQSEKSCAALFSNGGPRDSQHSPGERSRR